MRTVRITVEPAEEAWPTTKHNENAQYYVSPTRDAQVTYVKWSIMKTVASTGKAFKIAEQAPAFDLGCKLYFKDWESLVKWLNNPQPVDAPNMVVEFKTLKEGDVLLSDGVPYMITRSMYSAMGYGRGIRLDGSGFIGDFQRDEMVTPCKLIIEP